MRILHTADWHVGRAMRGHSRAGEHRAVLAEIATIAARERVDLVIVAGDLFDVGAPLPEAEEIVYGALLELADAGAQVVVISGNHDHPRRFEAIKPLLERTGRVHAGAALARPEEGGVLTLSTRSGETARVALFPFLSKRGVVKADELMRGEAAQHSQLYAAKCEAIVEKLCEPFAGDSVNLLVAHLLVEKATAGGGERGAHMHDDYRVSAVSFGHPALHYVALGHVHAAQRIPAPCQVWYCGSPLQLDFGETENEPSVLLVEARAGMPAEVERRAITAGRRLRTIKGTAAAIEAEAAGAGDAFLRVVIDEPPRPGLADEIRERYANVMHVHVAGAGEGSAHDDGRDTIERLHRAPREIFAEYLTELGLGQPPPEPPAAPAGTAVGAGQQKDDSGEQRAQVMAMFDELLEEAHAPDAP